MTDREMDRLTRDDSIYDASIASCSNNASMLQSTDECVKHIFTLVISANAAFSFLPHNGNICFHLFFSFFAKSW